VGRTVKEFGKIEVLVNNAAVFILRGIDATIEEWRRILDVNVIGASLVAKHVVPHIRKAGGGAIVNLGSISSFIAQPQFVTYNASKAAVANMTRCMALDLAADNIRVNAVCPGTVWTQIVQSRARADGLDRPATDPREIILLECAAAAPNPWYPKDYAQANGINRDSIDPPLDELRLGGLIHLTDWVQGKGQGYQLTAEGKQFLASPGVHERMRAGEPVARRRPLTEPPVPPDREGHTTTWDRGEAV